MRKTEDKLGLSCAKLRANLVWLGLVLTRFENVRPVDYTFYFYFCLGIVIGSHIQILQDVTQDVGGAVHIFTLI